MKSENMETSEKNVDSFDKRAKLVNRAKLNKKDYASPSLRSLGRLSTVTLGGSPGIGDSGLSNTYQPPLQ